MAGPAEKLKTRPYFICSPPNIAFYGFRLHLTAPVCNKIQHPDAVFYEMLKKNPFHLGFMKKAPPFIRTGVQRFKIHRGVRIT
jgi:hypothetical protein